MRMKVLVTGVGGQLGHDVMNELYARGCEGIGTDGLMSALCKLIDNIMPELPRNSCYKYFHIQTSALFPYIFS